MRTAYKLKGFPECTWFITEHSLSDNTMRQYDSTYRAWWEFCKQQTISPFKAEVGNVLEFLNKQFNEKKWGYGTFNSWRSALSLILSEDIGTDIRIRRFMKGISKLRPCRPKYQTTWNPQLVLNYVGTLYPNEDLSILKLSRKLATLLVLITGHRLQTISLIRIENIIFTTEGAQIFISDQIKSSSTKMAQPCLKVPFYPLKQEVCVASVLLSYIERTAELRNDQAYLFITSRPPFLRATKQTIARWVKETLKLSGVNVSVFSPHSIRHASTSAALRCGVSIDQIKKTAGWSANSQVFAKFYNRPLDEDFSFANAILEM